MQNFNTEYESDIFQMSRFEVVIIIIILLFLLLRGSCFQERIFKSLGNKERCARSVNLMALTATATVSTRNFIKNLSMHNPAIVYVPPFKGNIMYFVLDKRKDGIYEEFQPIIIRLIIDRNMGRVTIFCRTYQDAIAIEFFFLHALGEYSTEPKGSPNYVFNRVFDLYSHCTHPSVKENFLKQFTTESPLCLIIAISVFGMGIDCPDVRHIIHWGVPEDTETCIQESGRAGRAGKPAIAIIMKNA